jgi:hypothetical protein
MALLTVTGNAASRFEEVAHRVARLLEFELVTEARLVQWLDQEFGRELGEAFGDSPVPDRAWRPAVTSILARMAAEHHMVVAAIGSEALFETLQDTIPAVLHAALLRVAIVAPDARRIGNVMLDQRLERPEAKTELVKLDLEAKRLRKARLGRSTPRKESFDVILSGEQMDTAQMAEVLRAAASARDLAGQGFLPPATVAGIEFQTRLQLARHGIVPAQRAHLKRAAFSHPSEEMFANLLDFYRIQWQYEPRSFPLQWDKDGKVMEAFTPDFYLPEVDLYVELTTMKQALVTRKNRKIKLLRAVYPHINIQVFYQKDFQDLVFKYGLRANPS